MGNIADRVGRRRLLLIGAVGSGLSSALAAMAPTQRVAPLAAEGYWSHTAAGAGTHSPGDPDTLELIVNLAAGRAPSDAGAQGSPSKPPGSTA